MNLYVGNISELISTEANYITQVFKNVSVYMSNLLHGTNDRWLFSRDAA